MKQRINFRDIRQYCQVIEGHRQLDGKSLGLLIHIPASLMQQAPFNASAYDFLQGLRAEIFEFGLIEIAHLPLNRKNHTLAQKHPSQHSYSQNTFLTSYCQSPHQDTPPYPSAFWLAEKRNFSATWLMGQTMCDTFYAHQAANPKLSIDQLHQDLVSKSCSDGQALLINQHPGLCLIDNSQARQLYHARTALLTTPAPEQDQRQDTPMYAYNEIGLMQYIDNIDEKRGSDDRCEEEKKAVYSFMQQENLSNR